MMKFFRKHKKAVSPVIAVMLLVAVAVAAVGAYFIWFRSFQAQTQGAVQDEASGALGTTVQVISIANDTTSYYITLKNASRDTVSDVNVSVTLGTTPYSDLFTGTQITAGSSKTFTFQDTSVVPARGTTRVFTIRYKVGTSDSALVHTYTDA